MEVIMKVIVKQVLFFSLLVASLQTASFFSMNAMDGMVAEDGKSESKDIKLFDGDSKPATRRSPAAAAAPAAPVPTKKQSFPKQPLYKRAVNLFRTVFIACPDIMHKDSDSPQTAIYDASGMNVYKPFSNPLPKSIYPKVADFFLDTNNPQQLALDIATLKQVSRAMKITVSRLLNDKGLSCLNPRFANPTPLLKLVQCDAKVLDDLYKTYEQIHQALVVAYAQKNIIAIKKIEQFAHKTFTYALPDNRFEWDTEFFRHFYYLTTTGKTIIHKHNPDRHLPTQYPGDLHLGIGGKPLDESIVRRTSLLYECCTYLAVLYQNCRQLIIAVENLKQHINTLKNQINHLKNGQITIMNDPNKLRIQNLSLELREEEIKLQEAQEALANSPQALAYRDMEKKIVRYILHMSKDKNHSALKAPINNKKCCSLRKRYFFVHKTPILHLAIQAQSINVLKALLRTNIFDIHEVFGDMNAWELADAHATSEIRANAPEVSQEIKEAIQNAGGKIRPNIMMRSMVIIGVIVWGVVINDVTSNLA